MHFFFSFFYHFIKKTLNTWITLAPREKDCRFFDNTNSLDAISYVLGNDFVPDPDEKTNVIEKSI